MLSTKMHKTVAELQESKPLLYREMPLQMEIVPETAWYFNLRKMFSASTWDLIRNRVYAEFFYKCPYCEKEFWNDVPEESIKRPVGGGMHAHEIWRYDDETHIQHINGIVALCPTCHSIKHMVLTLKKIEAGEIKQEDIIGHFCMVNNCNPSDFSEALEWEMQIYGERSRYNWVCNIENFMEFINKDACKYVADESLIGNLELIPTKMLDIVMNLIEQKDSDKAEEKVETEEDSDADE